MKKLLAVGIILLLVGISIPSTGRVMEQPSTISSEGDILYVGGSGPGNYTKIQDAIDNASDGDTVFVYSNVYYETKIYINKSISLVGEDCNTTIINGYDAKYDILILTKNNTMVKGFTIRNAGHPKGGMVILSDNNVVINCKLLNNYYFGIYIGGSENTISYCEFNNNIWSIEFRGRPYRILNNVVSHCTFSSGNDVILLFVKNTVINNCKFKKCGIRCQTDYVGTKVKNCVFYNSHRGISMFGHGYNVSVENCLFLNCSREGIYLDYWQYNFTIRNCTFDNCGANGISCYVVGCDISNCKFINSTANGIYFLGIPQQCDISDCKFINNECGIEFERGIRQVKVNRCHFEGNKYGIQMNFRNFFNRIFENNFIDNTEHIYFEGNHVIIDFYKNNYWDDWRGWGPYHIKGFLNWDWRPALRPYDI